MKPFGKLTNFALRLLLNATRRENERLRSHNEALVRSCASWRRLALTKPSSPAHRSV